jgi:hypothetical protein
MTGWSTATGSATTPFSWQQLTRRARFEDWGFFFVMVSVALAAGIE